MFRTIHLQLLDITDIQDKALAKVGMKQQEKIFGTPKHKCTKIGTR